MIKRTESRAERFALNIINYHYIHVINSWATIVDFTDIYPLGAATHEDCGYTWSISTDGGFNLVTGSHPSPFFSNCYALIDNGTGLGQVWFKINPADKTAVTIAGFLTNETIAQNTQFSNDDLEFATLMNFAELSDCTQTAGITVVFPNDTEASDIELVHDGYSDTVAYSTPSALASYFSTHFQSLGFRVVVSGGTLIVQYNPLIGYSPTNGYNILTSTVFTVLGAGAPYPYELEINLQTSEICCDDDDFCYNWILPFGKRFAGFGLFQDAWQYEELAILYYSECNGDEIQEVNSPTTAIVLTTGDTVILYDFTMDLQNYNLFEFNISMLSHNAGAYIEEINRITEDNGYGFGSGNFGKFSGLSGDAALDVFTYTGWALTPNDNYAGANLILFNGLGSSSPAFSSGYIWSIDLNFDLPTVQQYEIDIWFYAKDVMPADVDVAVTVGGVMSVGANTTATVYLPNTICQTTKVVTMAAGVQTLGIGLGLSDGFGGFLPLSTGANDFVTVYASVKRAFAAPQEVEKGTTQQVFTSCDSCYVRDFLHENTMLENGFPGHLAGGFPLAFPVELNEQERKIKRQDTVYVTSRGAHIELNSQTDKELQFETNNVTGSQIDFMALAFGLTPFLLDGVQYAQSQPLDVDKTPNINRYKGTLVAFLDAWNKNRSLC